VRGRHVQPGAGAAACEACPAGRAAPQAGAASCAPTHELLDTLPHVTVGGATADGGGGDCPALPGVNHSKIIIGQSNATEVRRYQEAFPGGRWGGGVSMYWHLGDEINAEFHRLAQLAEASNASVALVAIHIGNYQDAAGIWRDLVDINAGLHDESLENFVATVVRQYSSLTWLVRIGYEVSLAYWANQHNEGQGDCPLPIGEPDGTCRPKTDDTSYLAQKAGYQAAFKHVAQRLHSEPNAKTVCHPYRLYAADPVNNAELCPRSGVDYFAVSVFNNDVCLKLGTQTSPEDGYCSYSETFSGKFSGPYDPNLHAMLNFAHARHWPVIIAESTTQPPELANPARWKTSLKRIARIVRDFEVAYWVYISTSWHWQSPPEYQFRDTKIWGDTRLEVNQDVAKWWSECVLHAPFVPATAPAAAPAVASSWALRFEHYAAFGAVALLALLCYCKAEQRHRKTWYGAAANNKGSPSTHPMEVSQGGAEYAPLTRVSANV
jgi:hypothetical protein